MKFKEKFSHGFTNRGCLHSAILKVYKARAMQRFLQNVQNEIFKILKMFKYNMKFTRAASWINSKISNRDKNITLVIFSFCHYCWSLLWCNYWSSLMMQKSALWSHLKLTVQISLAPCPCDPFLINNRNMTGNNVEKLEPVTYCVLPKYHY